MSSTNADSFLQRLHKKSLLNFDILVPFRKHVSELVQELVFFSIPIIYQSSKIIITPRLKSKPLYAQDWWPDSKVLPLCDYLILKKIPFWGSYYHSVEPGSDSEAHFPEEKKIRLLIKNLACKRIDWTINHPFNFKFYTWTVLHQHIFYCEAPYQKFPLGWNEFREDKANPPNRAYLKLWEIFLIKSHLNFTNINNSICIEVGCSPGGWTWVLAQYFKKVYAVDKAALDAKLRSFKSIKYKSADAFKLDPKDFSDATWFFSDIICAPEKMQILVDLWIKESSVINFISTIKFKGPVDFDFLSRFQEEKSRIGQSQLVHLYHNKNEVTWLFTKNQAK